MLDLTSWDEAFPGRSTSEGPQIRACRHRIHNRRTEPIRLHLKTAPPSTARR